MRGWVYLLIPDCETLCSLLLLFVWCLQVQPVLTCHDSVHLGKSTKCICEPEYVTLQS
jgi:hypothetical protein